MRQRTLVAVLSSNCVFKNALVADQQNYRAIPEIHRAQSQVGSCNSPGTVEDRNGPLTTSRSGWPRHRN